MQITAIFVLVVVGCAVAMPEAPLLRPGIIPVLSRTEIRDEVGQYALSYKTGNGISVVEQGALEKTADGKDYVLAQKGSYSYTAPDGTPISVTYVADKDGFRPEGRHLPVSVVA